MPIRMTATNVTEIAPGLWEFDLPPHQIRHFGNTANAIGARSVLVFREFEFDAAAGKLRWNYIKCHRPSGPPERGRNNAA